MSYSVKVEIVKDLPVEQIKKWEDKVVYGLARATLDFTNSAHYFPYKTGALNQGSMAMGVRGSNATYELGAVGVSYAPRVWKMGDNTNWTNPNTLPQWYIGAFSKHSTELVQIALKNAESELK
jgi:hypothetical protein